MNNNNTNNTHNNSEISHNIPKKLNTWNKPLFLELKLDKKYLMQLNRYHQKYSNF
jgi:hypothetical protein